MNQSENDKPQNQRHENITTKHIHVMSDIRIENTQNNNSTESRHESFTKTLHHSRNLCITGSIVMDHIVMDHIVMDRMFHVPGSAASPLCHSWGVIRHVLEYYYELITTSILSTFSEKLIKNKLL